MIQETFYTEVILKKCEAVFSVVYDCGAGTNKTNICFLTMVVKMWG